jgi:hypothetical protein
MNSHATDWTNIKINILMELATKFQDRERRFFPKRQWWVSPAEVLPIPHQTPKVLLQHIKQNNQERVVQSY